jgi:membrane protease YdiL (CAAX protease family)
MLHGFWIEPGFICHISWFPVLFSSVTGFVFAWQKDRTGSLLFPILTHGAIDVAIVLVRMFP